MKTIKIGSCDFWSQPLDLKNSFFYDIIEMCGYTPIIDNDDPDILFYSMFGNKHLKYTKPIKIWFSGENWGLPNFNECNFAFSGYFIEDERQFRCPLYLLYAREYINLEKFSNIDWQKILEEDSLIHFHNIHGGYFDINNLKLLKGIATSYH